MPVKNTKNKKTEKKDINIAAEKSETVVTGAPKEPAVPAAEEKAAVKEEYTIKDPFDDFDDVPDTEVNNTIEPAEKKDVISADDDTRSGLKKCVLDKTPADNKENIQPEEKKDVKTLDDIRAELHEKLAKCKENQERLEEEYNDKPVSGYERDPYIYNDWDEYDEEDPVCEAACAVVCAVCAAAAIAGIGFLVKKLFFSKG